MSTTVVLKTVAEALSLMNTIAEFWEQRGVRLREVEAIRQSVHDVEKRRLVVADLQPLMERRRRLLEELRQDLEAAERIGQ